MARDDTVEAMEYVLGLRDDRERRAFELALLDDPALAASVWRVEDRLAPLGTLLRPRKPAERVWREVGRRIAPPRPTGDTARRARKQVNVWRGLTGFLAVATVGAICIIAVMVLRPEAILPPPPALIAPLATPDGIALVRVSAHGHVSAEPLAASLNAGRQAALWLIEADGTVHRLGTLAPDQPTVLTPGDAPIAAAELAKALVQVTDEPDGPLGQRPTGPVIAAATLRAL